MGAFCGLFCAFCVLACSGFDAIPAAPHLYAREAARAQRLFDLRFGAKVLVVISERVVRVEDGPLGKQIRFYREDPVVINKRRMLREPAPHAPDAAMIVPSQTMNRHEDSCKCQSQLVRNTRRQLQQKLARDSARTRQRVVRWIMIDRERAARTNIPRE